MLGDGLGHFDVRVGRPNSAREEVLHEALLGFLVGGGVFGVVGTWKEMFDGIKLPP